MKEIARCAGGSEIGEPPAGGWELYDMKADRTETHDLAKEKPEKVEELAALYQTWGTRAGIKDWVGRQTPVGRTDAGTYKK